MPLDNPKYCLPPAIQILSTVNKAKKWHSCTTNKNQHMHNNHQKASE